jgi:hypothetical protein
MAGEERGSTIPMLVGFAVLLVVAVGVVVDSTAAYLRRESLNTLADGAALQGADLGAQGRSIYLHGLAGEAPDETRAAAIRGVGAYLERVRAYQRFPGLRVHVALADDSRSVRVALAAPMPLPLGVPGTPRSPTIRGSGEASLVLEDPR